MGLIIGVSGLVLTFVAHIIVTQPMPGKISDGVVFALWAGYVLAVLISGLAAGWVARRAALQYGGSANAALAITLPLFAIAAWIVLGFISLDNLCHFNDGFPLNSGDSGGRGC